MAGESADVVAEFCCCVSIGTGIGPADDEAAEAECGAECGAECSDDALLLLACITASTSTGMSTKELPWD